MCIYTCIYIYTHSLSTLIYTRIGHYQGVDSAYALLFWRIYEGDQFFIEEPSLNRCIVWWAIFIAPNSADLTSIGWFGRALLLKRSHNSGWEDVLVDFPRAYHTLNYNYRYAVTDMRDFKLLVFTGSTYTFTPTTEAAHCSKTFRIFSTLWARIVLGFLTLASFHQQWYCHQAKLRSRISLT